LGGFALIIFALTFPPTTFGATLFFDAINDSVTLLQSKINPDFPSTSVLSAKLCLIRYIAIPALNLQTISLVSVDVEFTDIFPLITFNAILLLTTSHTAMRVFILVIFPAHFL
jgi:hypothetical protein